MIPQINLEIQDFNTKLNKRAKLFGHVDLAEMNFDRRYFTKHGFHINNVGKDKLAKVIALQINKIFKPSLNDKFVIPLQWKDETTNNSSTVNTSHISGEKTAMDNPSKLDSPFLHDLRASKCIHRTSNRQNKARISRNSDFLW
jgi:hypothetical protein